MEVQCVDPVAYLGSLITNDFCHVWPIKSTVSNTPHQHKNQYQHVSRPGCLRFALWLWSMVYHPRRSPPHRCAQHALPNVPPACVLAAAHQQPKYPWTHQATNRIISPTTTPPTLVRTPLTHVVLPVRRVYDFNPNIHGWKRPRGPPKTRWADSINHDLHSASLDTTNAAQMVCDRSQWKAFVSGLPTLEPKEGS